MSRNFRCTEEPEERGQVGQHDTSPGNGPLNEKDPSPNT